MTYAIGNVLDVLPTLEAGRFRCCVTSPPYWGLRDYGHADQLGLEATPAEYVERMVAVFREVRRVLADDGTLWLNIGDSYVGGGAGEQGATGAMTDRSVAKQRGRVMTTTDPKYPGGDREAGRPNRKLVDGLKRKDLVGIPWMVAFALRADGWWLRQDLIWAKPSPLPESVTDRCTKSHEYVFLLSKSEHYHYDAIAIAEDATWEGQHRRRRDPVSTAMPGAPAHIGLRHDEPTGKRNARSVWTIATQPYDGAHFATMPPALAERCILAGSAIGDEVLDPFLGSGTTGMVAERNGRRWFGVELNAAYEPLIKARTSQVGLFGRTA